ncbi:TPA: cysteine-rich KTR domain-containing protein [Enterococcus faecium]|nr:MULTISPECIES: cysteine-rich KTR domain-containing protein [Enterococcus]
MCPICGNKTRLKIREDTGLINFPLYCPKCKQETLICIKQLHISVIKEPDAKTQSRQPMSLILMVIGFFF